MAVKSVLRDKQRRLYGTAAEFAAYAGNFAPGDQWEFVDQPGRVDEFNGSTWTTVATNGAAHVTLATTIAGEDQVNNLLATESARNSYETVAAGQTDQVLGGTGAIGDYLESVIITANTNTITVQDGTNIVAVIPGGSTGVWPFRLRSVAAGFRITTGLTTSCTCIGRFT